MKLRILLASFLAFTLSAAGQKMQTPAGEAPGPWILGTIGIGKQPDGTMKTTALKGLAIKVGEHGEAAVAYDLDLCRMAGAWVGKFTTPMNLMSRGEYPTALGEVAFTTGALPGFHVPDGASQGKEAALPGKGGAPIRDGGAPPASGGVVPPFGGSAGSSGGAPIASGGGVPPHGGTVAPSGGAPIPRGDAPISRNSAPAASGGAPVVRSAAPAGSGVAPAANGGGAPDPTSPTLLWKDPRPEPFGPLPEGQARFRGFYVNGDKTILKWDIGGVEVLEMPEWRAGRVVRLIDGAALPTAIDGVVIEQTDRLRSLTEGGPAYWPEPVVTTGELSKDTDSAYVVDTIKLPDPNPWGAPMFVGGFDFFPDGRAAVCTFHGDVFLVSGLDEKLEHVTWRRFASGLYHALGLKIVNGEIYVTCRDGIWRLKDLNGDGEADFYEAFNFEVKVTKSFHEFVFDLQTDPAGNFYFAKAGPVKNGGRGFDEVMAHHGSLFRVSPDGRKFDVIATGFRAPNGLGVGPHGELTSGDNEGTWTPVCRLNWITPGGFYGVVPLSHRDPLPTSYDLPLCWLPKRVDNSSGSQVWAPDGWGPWGGKMLHLSYGQAALYGVLFENTRRDALPRVPDSGDARVEDHGRAGARPSEMQGGVTKFPLQFQSGIMRARFSPKDGQLYVAGLRGWQTSGLKNGCFQRVRSTGAETRMPIELHVKKDGIELRFTTSLDTQSARDPENWHLEQWRYLWSAAYGSPELSTDTAPEAPAEAGKDGAAQFTKAQMSVAKHDPVAVKSVTIGTDDRTVFLEIPGLKPVMQMSIKYDLKTADGKELRGEVVNTIHALGE